MSPVAVPTMSFGKFSDRIHGVVGPARTPINGSIELTYRCNIQCEHCYIPHRSGEGELQTDDWRRVIDEATEAGCLFLLISGGEPFLRRDAIDIYLHAKRNGLLVTLFSNATMITPRIAQVLADYPPFSMEVSVYGASRETYGRVAKVPGAYDQAMRGIDLLLEARVPLALKTVVLTLNRDDLDGIRALAESRGLAFRFDATVHPRLDGNKAPLPIRLDPDEVVALDQDSPERLEELRELHELLKGPPKSNHVFQCGAGRNSFHIDPFGRLMLCESVESFGFDLREGSFHEGWRRYVSGVLALETAKHTRCQECTLGAMCGQCPAWSLMENGTLDDPVDYLCDITAARAEAMGLPDRPPGWKPGLRRQSSEREGTRPTLLTIGGACGGGCR